MDSNYLDFGVDSDSDGGDDESRKMDYIDSDEEDRLETAAFMKMFTVTQGPMPHSKTKKERAIENFQAEMEMELNRRATAIETEGGVEHQKSLSRSSSTSSLNAITTGETDKPSSSSASSQACSSTQTVKSSLKNKASNKGELDPGSGAGRSVRFAEPSLSTTQSKKPVKDKVKAMYDEIYFDSDEEEGADPEAKGDKTSRKFLSNDDLFYDPAADDKDQSWVDGERNAYFSDPRSKNVIKSKTEPNLEKPLPNSDAVLNCPACFTVLCLDCQRHDFYVGQFRAMFVRNCVVNNTENRYIPSKSKRPSNRKRKVNGESLEDPVVTPSFQTESSDTFNPVKCKVCNTEVAVFDSQEVYHFFNVLTSHS